MLEILAPAGNMECAKAAINSGADAVYLGFSAFSARQSAENFDGEGLRSIVLYAHLCNVKVYVAMNTLVKDEEIPSFFDTLQCVWETGVDAIILQDVFLGKYIKSIYPEIVLHLSTQAGICNENGAIFAKECGFSRVILARETPLAEIAKITKIIETEVFVQGALCYASIVKPDKTSANNALYAAPAQYPLQVRMIFPPSQMLCHQNLKDNSLCLPNFFLQQ